MSCAAKVRHDRKTISCDLDLPVGIQAPLLHVRFQCIDAFATDQRKLVGSTLWLDVQLDGPLLEHDLR